MYPQIFFRFARIDSVRFTGALLTLTIFLLQASVLHQGVAQTPASDASQLPLSVSLPDSQLKAAGIKTQPPIMKPFTQSIRLTGKVSLNEDRLAHIYPIVDGQVDAVHVGLGDQVEEGDLLVVVHSREIGSAKLDLYQAKLQLELAKVKQQLQQEQTRNTQLLLNALRENVDITTIQERFAGQNLGDYRERLLLAYSNYIKSEADVERLQGISNSGAVSSKQLLAAEATRNADIATFQARIEQIDYELKTATLQLSQQVKEAETRVAVCTTNLQILGCESEEIQNVDPLQQGESLSDFAIRAPLRGTIIWKDVVLREQVVPEKQLFSIADLSTVWIEANVYEKDVPLLQSLKDQPITFSSNAWPDRQFTAQVFFTGEIMDEVTRTISMRAIAQNPEHLLKPGMFVNIEFSVGDGDTPVIQVPAAAILEYEGRSFLFVQKDAESFERRDVQTGASDGQLTIIRSGIKQDDRVVVTGGFVLKSKLLESLMGEE